MSPWLLNHFFNPTFVAGGALLLALPVIIHLINRLRYRRVRFAAMEFLLQSQQRNRRRILFEQLLLLLMRMAIVASIVLLISRLILDPSQLSIFRGAKAHHVVLLDDSGSMRERWGETSAFRDGLAVVQQMLAEGAQRPDTQTFSLLRLSQPEQPFVSQRDVNEEFVLEMATKLEPATFECTHQSLDLVAGLRTALKYLQDEKGTVQQLHVVSDFRESDWKDQKAIAGAMEELKSAGVTVNLVKTVPQPQPNLAVTELSAAVQVAAAGVPLRVKVGVTNFGEQAARNVGVVISDDGVKLPVTVLFDEIEPRATAFHELDIRLTTATQHRLAAQVDADALAQDNARYLAVDVSPAVPVLIIAGNSQDEAATYVADALAADPASTGVSITLDGPDGLRRRSLEEFRVIYLLNVAELPADAVEALDRFVRSGGGLMWYLGDTIRPAHYNDALYREGDGIFPVRLGVAPEPLPADPTAVEIDLQPTPHPVFAVMLGQDNPFLASVHVRQYHPVAENWQRDDQRRGDAVRTIATLRNRSPLLLERALGQGRIMACLTTADPVWNDWARNPSFVVFQLDLLKHIARQDRGLPLRIVGEPIAISLDPALYVETVEVLSPATEGGRTTRLQASPETLTAESAGPLLLKATFRDTDAPGIYRVQTFNQAQQPESRMFAYNVPTAESDLAVATSANLRKRLGESASFSIQEPGQFTWLQGQEAGSEIRQWLLWALLALMIGEQVLAYRMSYHPATRTASAAA